MNLSCLLTAAGIATPVVVNVTCTNLPAAPQIFFVRLNINVTDKLNCADIEDATTVTAATAPLVEVTANTVDRFCAADATSVTVTFTVNSDVPYDADDWELSTEVTVLIGDTTPECTFVGVPALVPLVELQNESELSHEKKNENELNLSLWDVSVKIVDPVPGKLLCVWHSRAVPTASQCCP